MRQAPAVAEQEVGVRCSVGAVLGAGAETATTACLQSLVRGFLVRRRVWHIRPSRLADLRAYIAEEMQRERDVLYVLACQDDPALPSPHPARADMLVISDHYSA
eukprot:COSAG01_NODE_11419_length_1938_cov_14.231648_1_plen_104_part_00